MPALAPGLRIDDDEEEDSDDGGGVSCTFWRVVAAAAVAVAPAAVVGIPPTTLAGVVALAVVSVADHVLAARLGSWVSSSKLGAAVAGQGSGPEGVVALDWEGPSP